MYQATGGNELMSAVLAHQWPLAVVALGIVVATTGAKVKSGRAVAVGIAMVLVGGAVYVALYFAGAGQ